MRPEDLARNQIANSRLVHMNEQVLFPIINAKVTNLLDQVCTEFKFEGKIDPFKIASICAFKDMFAELEQIARTGDIAANKI